MANDVAPPSRISEMQDWARWISRELPRSPPFAAAVEGLKQLAEAPHERTTGALAEYAWEELLELRPPASSHRAVPARAWINPAKGGDYGYEHVRSYVSAVRHTVRRFIGSDQTAGALHEHVRGGALFLPLANHPAPGQAQASRLAAYVTGASWALGGATAMRQVWRHHRPSDWPPAPERFSFYP